MAVSKSITLPKDVDALARSDVAELLGISERTLQRMAARGTGPSFQIIGQKPYYSIDALREWLKGQDRQEQ